MILLWTPTYCRAKAGRPARTYIQQLCEDTGCSPKDLPEAMNDQEKWRERVRDIRASITTWWWWLLYTWLYFQCRYFIKLLLQCDNQCFYWWTGKGHVYGRKSFKCEEQKLPIWLIYFVIHFMLSAQPVRVCVDPECWDKSQWIQIKVKQLITWEQNNYWTWR